MKPQKANSIVIEITVLTHSEVYSDAINAKDITAERIGMISAMIAAVFLFVSAG